MNKCLALLLFFLNSLMVFGQNQYTLSGKLIDQENAPIAFATIALFENTSNKLLKASTSDVNGLFEVEALKAGTYTLKISFVGFTNYEKILEIKKDTDLKTIALSTSVNNLKTIEVSALRPLVEIKPNKTVFNVEGTINASGSDGLELLRKAPGVIVDNDNNISLKGKSGVQIYIDNKPTQMDGEDLTAYLESLSADQIDNIEIISNPSARFDAAGSGGIINVILKKQKLEHLNATINAGYNQGFYPKFNLGTTLNYRKNKTNFFFSYNYRDRKMRSEHSFYREQNDFVLQSDASTLRVRKSHNLKTGIDYSLNKKNTIGFYVEGNFTPNGNSLGLNDAQIGPLTLGFEELLNTYDYTLTSRNNRAINLNYLYKDTNDHVFMINLDYGQRTVQSDVNQQNNWLALTDSSFLRAEDIINERATQIDLASIKLDYQVPLWDGNLALGHKTSQVNTTNDFLFYDVISGNKIINTDQTNDFEYKETVYAFYIEYQKTIKKFDLSLGLRDEYTDSDGRLTSLDTTQNTTIKRDYNDLFPSFGVSYNASKKQSFSLNYSKRLDRPSFRKLNPFQYRMSSITYRAGNPLLTPQYTHNIELSHSFRRFLNTSVSYTLVQDFTADVVKALDSNITIQKPYNIENQKIISLNNSLYIPVSKKYTVYLSNSLSNIKNQSFIDSSTTIDLNVTVWNLYMQNTFTIFNDVKMEVSGWISSPGIWQGNMPYKWQGSLDLGFQKKIMKERGKIRLSFSDILFTSPWRVEAQTDNLYLLGGGNWESRQVRLNFSYTFGNQKIRAKRIKTGLDDENKRASGGEGR